MVVFCKRCGSPVKIDNARLADPAYGVNCQQCQRPVAMEAVRRSARPSKPTPDVAPPGEAAPVQAAPAVAPPAPPAEPPTNGSVPPADRAHSLQKIRLFRDLPYEECRAIERHLRLQEYAPQQVIVKEGGPGDAMYFITAGAVEVRKRDPNTGIDFLLSQLTAGSCFGEMALLTGRPRVASVVAVEPTTCSVVEQGSFDEVLLSSPKLGLAMSRVLAERLEEATQQAGLEYINTANMASTYAELRRKDDARREAAGGEAVSGSVAAGEPGPEPRGAAEKAFASLQSAELGLLDVVEGPAPSENVTDLSHSADDEAMVRTANNILALAIQKEATDIHVEPQENDLAVRFRIEGALQVVDMLPKKIQLGLVARFKTLAKLDVVEKRMPQEGRIRVRRVDRGIDFRVSTIPSKWGEKICMRVQDRSGALQSLDKLILHQESLQLVREMMAQPYGIIYITGPAGSGKTTLLYSALAELNDRDVNVSTVEDPIEFDLPWANQVQAQKEIGLDFPRILRAFLRQDPDIVMISETRDKETAHLAVEAALTGHLVLTSLDAQDAVGAFGRLDEMGIEPFLMASSTSGVIAQRLARRLCENCKESYEADDISLRYLGLDPGQKLTFYRQRGCARCSGTGYRGRIGLYEVLRMGPELRRLVAGGTTPEAVAALAMKHGMKTLKEYAGWLLQNGWTTMDEVLQVISVQE